MIRLILAATLAISVSGCLFKKDEKAVLQVGQFQFTAFDLARRKRVLQYYYPNDKGIDPKADLIRVYSAVEAMAQNGLSNFRDRVIAEDKRIDSSTLDPTGLARIKRIFGDDIEAYRRLFVAPNLVPGMFADMAGRHPAAQAKSRGAVSAFIEAATKHPKQFAELAKKTEGKRQLLRISEEKGVRWDDGKAALDPNAFSQRPHDVDPVLSQRWEEESKKRDLTEAQRWVRVFAPKLKPGQVAENIVEKDGFWMAVRFLGVDVKSKDILFDTVRFSKDPVEPWQTAETAKVLVKDL